MRLMFLIVLTSIVTIRQLFADPIAGAAASDASSLTGLLAQTLATVLIAFLIWSAKRLNQFLAGKISAQNLQALDQAAMKATTAAIVDLQDIIAAKGWDHADVKGAVVARALALVQQRFPDAINDAGLSSDAGLRGAQLKNLLERIFPDAALAASNSPVTPPVPPPQPAAA